MMLKKLRQEKPYRIHKFAPQPLEGEKIYIVNSEIKIHFTLSYVSGFTQSVIPEKWQVLHNEDIIRSFGNALELLLWIKTK